MAGKLCLNRGARDTWRSRLALADNRGTGTMDIILDWLIFLFVVFFLVPTITLFGVWMRRLIK